MRREEFFDDEEWVPIPDFPMYAVSDYGRVMNMETETLKIPSPNQQGIVSVNLMLNGKQCRRSVSVLVANAFLPKPTNQYAHTFDTPINLDGDRMNNHVSNLMWRPRWFAVKYHAQLKRPNIFGFRGTVELIDTGEIFEHVRDCAIKYGLLETDIIQAAHNEGERVFPTWFTFRLVH